MAFTNIISCLQYWFLIDFSFIWLYNVELKIYLNGDKKMNETWLSRTELMLGEDALTKLKKSKVAVFGCGGVGSYTLDSLVRAGVRKYCYNR